MKRKVPFSSKTPMVLTDYEEKNKPENQHHIDGIAIDPNLCPDFDITDLNDRDREEVKDWWNRPFIVTTNWGDIEWRIEAEQALVRLGDPQGAEHLLEQLEQAKLAAKLDWFERYPYGVRYEIRCLDGSLPDRSTVWGAEGTIKAAIRRAKEGPMWQHSITDEQKPGITREFGMREKDVDKKVLEFWLNQERDTDENIQTMYWLQRFSTAENISDEEHKAFKKWCSQNCIRQAAFQELMEHWGTSYFKGILQEKLRSLENLESENIHNNRIRAEPDFEKNPSDLYDDEPATEVEIQAVYWFKIMSDTSVSDADHKAFRGWLAEDEKHQAVYSELKDLWDNQYFELALLEKKYALEKKGDMDQVSGRETAVTTEERTAREDNLASIERKLRRLPSLGVYTAIAACCVFAAFAWVTRLSSPAHSRCVPYQTSVGELRSITLSDGSIVNLNKNTQICVTFNEDYRKVALSHGDAHFDVVKDGRPFLVEGGTGLVKVVGAAFEVKVDDDQMVVLVERGRVVVSPVSNEAQYAEVTPQQRVAVLQQRLGEVEFQPLYTPIADWRDGWLEFNLM